MSLASAGAGNVVISGGARLRSFCRWSLFFTRKEEPNARPGRAFEEELSARWLVRVGGRQKLALLPSFNARDIVFRFVDQKKKLRLASAAPPAQSFARYRRVFAIAFFGHVAKILFRSALNARILYFVLLTKKRNYR